MIQISNSLTVKETNNDNLRNFFNSVSGNNRIFTSEDIGDMSKDEFASNEKAIRHQWDSVGIPSDRELSGSDDVVYVQAYTRGDGTEVRAHYRSKGGGRIGIGTVTGGAVDIVSNTAVPIGNIESAQSAGGMQQGNSMSDFRARRGVNPTGDMGNCQSANVVYQARKQGYDVSALPLDESNPVMMDLGFNPQNAYIDPSTGAPPEVKCSYSYDEDKCLDWLKANIKTGETYTMSYVLKNSNKGIGHVVEVTKTKNGDIKFYDPQTGENYGDSLLKNDVLFPPEIGIKFPENIFPQIFRVDNAKINVEILNKISKPRR